jgi:pSer/pThr/pTyr-binding forkhead associated (FHA) protein
MSIEFTWYQKEAPDGPSRQSRLLEGAGPFTIGRSNDCDIVLADTAVSRLHARVSLRGEDIEIADAETPNGTRLDGNEITTTLWPSGSNVEIGGYVIETRRPNGEGARTTVATPPTEGAFPPAEFDNEIVSVPALSAMGLVTSDIDYLTLGGGIGSFVWVDHLRVFGVDADKVRAIGVDPVPYGKYERLCRYSQIPVHERLRSNSLSTPDNIWGFPGYASRESWRELRKGNIGGLKYVMQVFGEPALAESYTPQAGDVFSSMDREAERIGWDKIWMAGRIIRVRKTDDGRFAVAYRVPADLAKSGPRNRIAVARHLHIAMGYPASRYLDDLQEFKRRHPTSHRVINAYEHHDQIYDELEANGGNVLVRGRGIVASRILQRLHEARATNKEIRVLHVMRSRIVEGKTYDLARRFAAHDIEYQPFNWPKACWGGTLRERLENADEEERLRLLGRWGGTTTADRSDWDAIITEGKRDGWYRPFFGNVEHIELRGDKIISQLESSQGFREEVRLEADYIIDCTGLIAELDANPVLRDLIDTYGLKRNPASGRGPEQRLSGLKVTNDFEIEGLRNGRGRAYAAGVMTLNGPYAAVDSFLGLQYAALRSVDDLAAHGAPGITAMGPVWSAWQWWKWCQGQAPGRIGRR